MLYASPDLVDRVIEVASDDDVAHIEVYAGGGTSWASRNGIGVGLYPFRSVGLKYVRRPVKPLNLVLVNAWFPTVNGAPYGWGDIAANVGVNLNLAGMDCSHFVAVLCEVGECPQFDSVYPKDKIKPAHFKLVRESVCIAQLN